MKLSEYIAMMNDLLLRVGDIDVVRANHYGPIGAFSRNVFEPAVRSVKEKGSREHHEKTTSLDGEKTTGELVVVL